MKGDPWEPTGIAAITRRVASKLSIPRCLVALDETIDPEHAKLADREGVKLELRFNELSALLKVDATFEAIVNAIDEEIASKNRKATSSPGGRALPARAGACGDGRQRAGRCHSWRGSGRPGS